MNHTMLALFGAAIGLYALQAVGAYYQMRQYKRAVHRLHQLGNVGIGQKRGGFSFGYLVLVVCDNDGIIQTVERMRGITCFAAFRPLTQLNGRTLAGSHIEEWQAAFRSMDKKQRRKHKGYIQAMEALDMRLYPQHYSEEALQHRSMIPQISG